MLATLQVLPLRADGLVALHLRHGLGIAETIALELLDEVVEDEGVGTLLAILGQHTYQQDGIPGKEIFGFLTIDAAENTTYVMLCPKGQIGLFGFYFV